jgi:hypothetical protein
MENWKHVIRYSQGTREFPFLDAIHGPPSEVKPGVLHANPFRRKHRVSGTMVLGASAVLLWFACAAVASAGAIKLRVSWGHRSTESRPYYVRFDSQEVSLGGLTAQDLETGDKVSGGVCTTTAGAGDIDGVFLKLSFADVAVREIDNLHSIWAYLIQHGDAGAAGRLKQDPAYRPDRRKLTVCLDKAGTRGFSLTVDQLLNHQAFWMPESDIFVSVGDAPPDFDAHLASLKGRRVLDRVAREPETTLAEWTGKWADFGSPHAPNHGDETSWLGTKGHLTGLIARHGSVYKFGVDRWARVRPDLAAVHRFRFDPLWPECRWVNQRIVNGLPVIITELERKGQSCQIQQFAAPLAATSPSERGKIASVLFTRIKISGTGPVRFGFRLATENKERHPELRKLAGRWCVVDRETNHVWLMIEPGVGLTVQPRDAIADTNDPRLEFECVGELDAGQTRTIVVKLTAPVCVAETAPQLAALDVDRAHAASLQYWQDWLARGAHFEVPEQTVNDLFRANLWHALLLPRHRSDERGVNRIDLPYSNFAYGQYNADWPINQAVYVDYMIYGLRGYFDVAEEEFAAMYQSQQQADGRVAGYANWGVYSPSMLYSIGQNFLLSGDRESFARLLPASLRTLDWCLKEIAAGQQNQEAPGLIVAPLNDLTHDARAWAFPNAYFVAGLDVFGRALASYGHPRAAEVRAVAKKMSGDVTAAFARGSVYSPVVQLADGTWSNYVPCDATTPRRLLDVWYPTDVDVGPLHLSRLAAIDPCGWLTTAMLHDHEDNLFLHQWGMANEPVYNQQATAYLWRDEPKAAIRALYSMMACAFSRHQLTPLEHRWAWGQYYMPPSTDGAWFELYRNMLVRETDDDMLLLFQATPRKWLEHGKKMTVERAPTYYGRLSMTVHSQTDAGKIVAHIDMPRRSQPGELRVRFRHPDGQAIRAVTVNGEPHEDFDTSNEWVRITHPSWGHYTIEASY